MMSRYVLGELERLLANLIQIGTVTAFNPDDTPPTVQVDLGEQETDPIPISMGRAGSTKDWNPPAIGEQVMVFCPCGDVALAFSLGGLFQDACSPPSRDPNRNMKVFPDGSGITHDSGSNTLTVTIAGSGNININCVNAQDKWRRVRRFGQRTACSLKDCLVGCNAVVSRCCLMFHRICEIPQVATVYVGNDNFPHERNRCHYRKIIRRDRPFEAVYPRHSDHPAGQPRASSGVRQRSFQSDRCADQQGDPDSDLCRDSRSAGTLGTAFQAGKCQGRCGGTRKSVA